jgi:hypothetical protein
LPCLLLIHIISSDSALAISIIVPSADAQDAIKHSESSFSKQLSPILKKIAIEAYDIRYRMNRGITVLLNIGYSQVFPIPYNIIQNINYCSRIVIITGYIIDNFLIVF